MITANQELLQLAQLLELERNEEIKQSSNLIQNIPLAKRVEMGVSWYPVRISNEEIGLGEQYIIEIEQTRPIALPHKFQQGQTLALFGLDTNGKPHKQTLRGIVQKVNEQRLWLSVRLMNDNTDLPEWYNDAKMGVDLLFDETTFKEMEIALRTVIEAKGNRIAELREILSGKQPAYFSTVHYPVYIDSLNASQNKAIDHILRARDVAVVHGPPGTGKTTTLVQAIIHTLYEEKQVLVCAQSNTAVDLLTEKLAASGITVLRLGHPARIDSDLQRFTFDASFERHSQYQQLKNWRREAQKLQQQARKFKRNFGPIERAERQNLLQTARDLMNEVRNLEKFLIQDTLNIPQVITTTLVGAATPMLKNKVFSTVFIDEASQALEPATWIPILKAKRVVFAGDHCQLPPTVKSNEALRKGFAVTLFEKCIDTLPESVMLNEQYRMHQTIMGFSSGEFYNQQLIAHPTVQSRQLGEAEILQTSFEFIDTAGSGFDEQTDNQTESKLNPQEADFLLRHLNNIWLQLAAEQPNSWHTKTLGIISPYKAQVKYLAEQLQNYPQLWEAKAQITIQTIDGFQGQERDCIGISLVRSNANNEIGFLSDTRRMNVALTRAKTKLVVVGNSATISSNAFYQRFLDYTERNNLYRTIWEYNEW